MARRTLLRKLLVKCRMFWMIREDIMVKFGIMNQRLLYGKSQKQET